jgi:hypothetical protein
MPRIRVGLGGRRASTCSYRYRSYVGRKLSTCTVLPVLNVHVEESSYSRLLDLGEGFVLKKRILGHKQGSRKKKIFDTMLLD